MSVVVAIKKNNMVYLGADSQVTRGGSRSSLSNVNNYKIWKVKGVEQCYMGAVGALRDSCVLRIINGFVREIDAIHDDIDYEYVVNRIEPMIRDVLIEHKFVKEDNPYETMDSRFLFVYKNKIFTIEYGAVIEHDDFVVIGSGESEAVGSLLSLPKELDVNERIIKAIKASAAHDIYVDYPIILANTKDCNFEVITEKNEREFFQKGEKNEENSNENSSELR